MAWSKITTRNKKPLGWWKHKFICEFGYFLYCKFSYLKIGSWGHSIYYRHLNKMCMKYNINLYGEKYHIFHTEQWTNDNGTHTDLHMYL